MNRVKLASAMAILFLCSACATVTIRPNGGAKATSKPTYESSYGYFIFGLVGDEKVNVSQICNGGAVDQIQTEFTFMDKLLGTLTGGLYAPKTAKVWCK